MTDIIIKTIYVYIFIVSCLMICVFLTNQKHAPKNTKTTLHILCRTGLLCLVLFIACWMSNDDPVQIACFSVIVALIIQIPMLYFGGVFPAGLFVFAFLAEWLIGFPSKKEYICTQNRSDTQTDTDENMIGAEAVTLSALRPTGKIQIGENEHDAKSDFGFIDKNRKVKIVAKKGFSFVVRQT